ncbi:hypothetical protein NW768_004105 [Fusarium equiseti]|uniref:Uncharacterized protein n=1 Tax=Fusarium equiseti TaxID=61235 RepID=A0ABQ8RJI7_FUSEQ|nr:hypothetical protein NW768_004105 [Fusarium equiseti]
MSQPHGQPPTLPPLQHPTILTEIEFAVIMYSGANWKVVNMDRNGPQKNIIWRIPGSNNFLARVVCAQAYVELNRFVGTPGGNNIRAFVNNWEDEVTLSAIACSIRVNEDGKVEYVPGGARPERQEEFVPWLGGTLGFDVVDMSG